MSGIRRRGDHSPTYHFPLSFEKPTYRRKFYHSQTFHNYFLKGLDTASAFTKLDVDMGQNKRVASAVLVALATLALSGCGADDSAPSAASTTPAAANNDAAPNAAAAPATPILNASSTLAADPAAASDPITQNMQASLAADNQQVAPVMHYAPGDSASSN
ncbi:hypothetical protein VSR69_12265 [Paraburkholderia phytofirmans]|jgi:hypothetical protein|uniref:hypothetical protein n=1 Tax=unclassified Paraburkholderia TaxID=2615204 RepID=UPI001FB1BF3F|nr:hypothetical protein [Paraburkholderia sp. BL9I2N2]